ncbi:MAG: hypothetical protein KOO69_06720 [Victivallales bacterium]|nr:hypothetical protein [Victivallales bacterium]
MCQVLRLHTVSVIQAANEGYPRNPIPVPSPGVGGICLKKDPYILSESASQYNLDLSLVKEARNINEYMPKFVSNIIQNYISKHGSKKDKIFIIGIAFKGHPETSDIRNSTALELIKILHCHPINFNFCYIFILLSSNFLCFKKLKYRFLKIPAQVILRLARS